MECLNANKDQKIRKLKNGNEKITNRHSWHFRNEILVGGVSNYSEMEQNKEE